MAAIYGIAAGMFCVFFILFSLKKLHTMQLEGYDSVAAVKSDETYKRVILFLSLMILGALFSLFSLLCRIAYLDIVCFIIDGILMSLFLFSFKEKHKIKLKITKRAFRILSLQCVFGICLCALICAPCFILHEQYYMLAFLPSILFFSEISLSLAIFVLRPIETAIKQRYIKKAKKVLDSRKDLIKIGITGSYGKTSVKNILTHMLRCKYNVLATPESYNTPMGICKSVKMLDDEHEVFVAEMGARHVGDIKELCDMVHPRYAILTGINHQHIETFICIENTIKTKMELIDSLPSNGFAVINGDSELCSAASDLIRVEFQAAGIKPKNDLKAENITVNEQGSRFDLVGNNIRINCQTRLLGRHNVSNITLAACLALKLGVSVKEIAEAISSLTAVKHRLELMDAGGLLIIDDTFNANETGVKSALEVLSLFESRRKIIVTPGLVEQGNHAYTANFEVGKNIAEVCDLAIVIGKHRSRPIVDGLLSQNFPSANIIVKNSLEEAKSEFGKILRAGDIVLLENDLPDNYNE